jgi:hypothetical protein
VARGSEVSAGFYKRRRGILEHIEASEIDLLESGIHDYLSLKANLLIGSPSSIPVGICFTSAPAIHAHCKRVSERTIQRCLAHLEEIGWLKTFRSPNQRGNYPALICRASVHDLAGNEYRINASATTDWRHPVYEAVGQVSPETSNPVGKVAGIREEREEKREKRAKTDHPKKRDDAVSRVPSKSFPERAKQTLSEKYPGDGEEQISFGLQLIEERAFNSMSHPRSEAYFITSYDRLRLEETFKDELQWYRENPLSNDQRSKMNAVIRRAEEESRKTGRDFFECFDELKNKPFEEMLQ